MIRRLPSHIDVGDLIGAGSEGLLKAVDGYDHRRYPVFEPYAELRVRGAIIDELRRYDAMTRYGRQQLGHVTRTIKDLTQSLGRQPEEEEVADALDMSLEDYQKLSESLARGPALGRLRESEPDALGTERHNPAATYEEDELKRRLVEAIEQLPERKRMVLALYYQEECTQAEIGEILGVTESRVCQILGETAARLRAMLESGPPRTRPTHRPAPAQPSDHAS
jgi:RNA polymerase sigma factor for flagellar operon FliA